MGDDELVGVKYTPSVLPEALGGGLVRLSAMCSLGVLGQAASLSVKRPRAPSLWEMEVSTTSSCYESVIML